MVGVRHSRRDMHAARAEAERLNQEMDERRAAAAAAATAAAAPVTVGDLTQAFSRLGVHLQAQVDRIQQVHLLNHDSITAQLSRLELEVSVLTDLSVESQEMLSRQFVSPVASLAPAPVHSSSSSSTFSPSDNAQLSPQRPPLPPLALAGSSLWHAIALDREEQVARETQASLAAWRAHHDHLRSQAVLSHAALPDRNDGDVSQVPAPANDDLVGRRRSGRLALRRSG
ncbi:hypothetical protein ACLB2K_023226 [Fragaria x ananassa]